MSVKDACLREAQSLGLESLASLAGSGGPTTMRSHPKYTSKDGSSQVTLEYGGREDWEMVIHFASPSADPEASWIEVTTSAGCQEFAVDYNGSSSLPELTAI